MSHTREEEKVQAQTPLLKQYFQIRESHPGSLLAMRIGDFYEFYGEDAEVAAGCLEIVLTGREDGANGRIAMAGVPFHAMEKYLARLVAAGHKVAICEQVEDPKKAKGLVKREVIRVLTPGTLLEDSMLAPTSNNYLSSVCVAQGNVGLATLDSSTGELFVTEFKQEDMAPKELLNELARLRPAEVLLSKDLEEWKDQLPNLAITLLRPPAPAQAHSLLTTTFGVHHLKGFGCEDMPGAIAAAAMALAYAKHNGLPLEHIDAVRTYSLDHFMTLDESTRRSLELAQNLTDGSRQYTLLGVLDRTVTAMGARMMRRWIEQPLLGVAPLKRRHDSVERLVQHSLIRGDLRDILGRLSDIERLVSRAATGLAGPKDLAALRNSLNILPRLAEPMNHIAFGRLQELREGISEHPDLTSYLNSALVTEPPFTIREGGVIATGLDPGLDKLRDVGNNSKQFIAELEQKERAMTGISTLKVGFNSVFGYYLEVGKAHLSKVPSSYIRKQTTANAERYITAELKEQESLVLGAEEKALELEAELFYKLRAKVAAQAKELLQTARALAELDVLLTFAEVAVCHRYVLPSLIESDTLVIESGRHPVVEAHTNQFVPNDLDLGLTAHGGALDEASLNQTRTVVLTGPNMSGKSTYLRQTALIVLMAQIGSFVPAKSCTMGLCDRIFARIGAKDELALGQSTFMVEMLESANILNHASSRSLVILDEVGRGTSTYDGLAIAWAMLEELAAIGCKTLFATHYHQLNALADQLPVVGNFRVSVEEIGDQVIWTHKVLPGGTDRSYGIHVARMAGVPRHVLVRAGQILSELEQKESFPKALLSERTMQLTLFEAEVPPVLKALAELDLNHLTPMQALQTLESWRERFSKKN